MRSRVVTSYRAGLIAEWRARWYLRLRGFRILASRYVTGRHTGCAEIDIIARRGNLIIFVEVKRRSSICGGFDAITPAQSVRLRRSAETYLAQMRWVGDARFDAIIVCDDGIHWVHGVL